MASSNSELRTMFLHDPMAMPMAMVNVPSLFHLRHDKLQKYNLRHDKLSTINFENLNPFLILQCPLRSPRLTAATARAIDAASVL